MTATEKKQRTEIGLKLKAMGLKVAHSRQQRNGSVTFYLFMTFGDEKVTEVRWNPRREDEIHLYAQRWVNTNCGNIGGHQEDVYVTTLSLAAQL
jgi:hypothetical protein